MNVAERNHYHRILLKLGGELFAGEGGWGVSFPAYEKVARDIVKIRRASKVQLSIVVGGGNILRGREVEIKGRDKATIDYMGMLATVINGLALQDALERLGAEVRMMTAIEIRAVAEPFIRRRAIKHLEKGRIVIFTAGTGSPFFTTDSAAALRACEIGCDLVLKATNVDGIYSADPHRYPEARRYTKLSYREVIEKRLDVMDATAFALCWKEKKPIVVFDVNDIDKIPEIIRGKTIGTLVS